MQTAQTNARCLPVYAAFGLAVLLGLGGCPGSQTNPNADPDSVTAGITEEGDTVYDPAGEADDDGNGPPSGDGDGTLPPGDGDDSSDSDPMDGDDDAGEADGGDVAPPRVYNRGVWVAPDTPTRVVLQGLSPSGQPLEFAIVSPPANGNLSAIEPIDDVSANVTYTPPDGFLGQAQFSYFATDGSNDSNVATVTVLVSPPVYFELDAYEGAAPLTVTGYAFTMTGDPLPEGEYQWDWGDLVEGGPVQTFGVRAHTYERPGAYRVGLSVLLVGLAQPIVCTHSHDQKQDQYASVQVPAHISGYVRKDDGTPLAGVLLATNDGKDAVSGADGGYVLPVPFRWSGTVTPSLAGFSFAPPSISYPQVASDEPDQDFVGADTTSPGVLYVFPAEGLVSSGTVGGPFSPASKDYTLTNTGGQPINWTAAKTQAWVSLASASGTLAAGASATVTVLINSAANSLAIGSYSDTVSFTNATNGSGNTTRAVSLTVNAPPGALSVTPTTNLISSGTVGGPFSPASNDYTLTNTGGQAINWTASKTQAWVSLASASGTLAAGASTTVTVSINSSANSLAAGSYSDTVSFTNATNGSGNTTRAVSLTVNAPPGALSVTPTTNLVSSGTVGGPFTPASKDYMLTNTGGQALNWTASKTQAWVSLSSASGTLAAGASTTVTVSINSSANSLAAGSYSDTVAFTNTTTHSGDTTRGVNLTIDPPPGALSVTPTTNLVSSGTVGGPFSPASEGYTLTNTGGQAINWTAAKTQAWVSLASASGTLAAGASTTVTVSINSGANSLAAGSYSDTVSFTNATNGSGNTTRAVSLTVNAPPGALSVTPTANLVSSGTVGGPFSPASKDYTLTNTGGQALNWTAAKTQAWVSLSSTSGTLAAGASTTVTVSINSGANSLAAGSYSDTVSFTNATNGSGNTTRSVALTVSDGPQMASSVSQYGITWTFDHNYQVGQFVNGDWWVLGPVTVVAVDPPPSVINQTDRNGANPRDFRVHGSMANPLWGYYTAYGSRGQAYDERITGVGSPWYDNSLCLTFPYDAAVNTSIVSTRSWIKGESGCPQIVNTLPYAPWPSLKDAAVLTVLEGVPSATAFRPAYCGTTKTIYDSVNLSLNGFPNVTPTASMPSVLTATSYVQRCWLDHGYSWVSDYFKPSNNMPDSSSGQWPANLEDYYNSVCLMLMSNSISDQDKRALAIHLCQIGIDTYGVLLHGGTWYDKQGVLRTGGAWGMNGGGHSHMRKWPIILTGILLGDADMKAIGTTQEVYRFEDAQVFYITQTDIDRFASETVTRTNCTVSAASPNLIVDNDGGSWYVRDGGGSLGSRGPREYWVEFQGTLARINGVVNDSTLRCWTPLPVADGQLAIVRVFPQARLGSPDWANLHFNQPYDDDDDKTYIMTTGQYVGAILAARMLDDNFGAVSLWNYSAIFDLVDWYVQDMSWWVEHNPGDAWQRIKRPFIREMWDTYRGSY